MDLGNILQKELVSLGSTGILLLLGLVGKDFSVERVCFGKDSEKIFSNRNGWVLDCSTMSGMDNILKYCKS